MAFSYECMYVFILEILKGNTPKYLCVMEVKPHFIFLNCFGILSNKDLKNGTLFFSVQTYLVMGKQLYFVCFLSPPYSCLPLSLSLPPLSLLTYFYKSISSAP